MKKYLLILIPLIIVAFAVGFFRNGPISETKELAGFTPLETKEPIQSSTPTPSPSESPVATAAIIHPSPSPYPREINITDQAEDSQRTSNVNAILNAVWQYITDRGEIPDIPDGEIDSRLCRDLTKKYLPALPTDPLSESKGKAIAYENCGEIDPGDVLYYVTRNSADGKITVSANAKTDLNENGNLNDDIIEVTR